MGRIVYAPWTDVIDSDATLDIWNVIGTSAIRMRLLGFEVTSNAVAATLTTLTLGFATDNGTGGTATTEQNADDSTVAGQTAAPDLHNFQRMAQVVRRIVK